MRCCAAFERTSGYSLDHERLVRDGATGSGPRNPNTIFTVIRYGNKVWRSRENGFNAMRLVFNPVALHPKACVPPSPLTARDSASEEDGGVLPNAATNVLLGGLELHQGTGFGAIGVAVNPGGDSR